MRIALIISIMLLSTSLFAQWTNLNSGTTEWLRSVWFTGQDTGYVAGFNGTILKTEDGGSSWSSLSSGTTSDLQGIFFINSTTGWAVGSGTILKTTNSGLSWTPQFSPLGSIFHQVVFLDLNNGYIAGESGVCLKTTDGGSTWTSMALTSGNGRISVYFKDVNTGFLSGGGFADAISKTTDGGSTWTNVYTNTVQEFASITFTDSNNGFAVSTGGKIATTTNGGNSWITQPSGAPSLYSIVFPTPLSGYTVGGFPNTGSILHTIDGGTTWLPQISNTTSPLFGVFFTNPSIGYAVGKNGSIIKTTNGGVGIEKQEQNNFFSLYPNPASNSITVKAKSNGNNDSYQISISNIEGQELVKVSYHSDGKIEIPVSDLAQGLYFLTINSGEDSFTTKFFKN